MADVSTGAGSVSAGEATLADLLSKGKFSEYHLLKARSAMAAGNAKEAHYQALASLAHDPSNAEAKSIRTSAKAAAAKK